MFGTTGMLWTVVSGIGTAAVNLVGNFTRGKRQAGQLADQAREALNWSWLESTGEKLAANNKNPFTKTNKKHWEAWEESFQAATGHTVGQTAVNWDGQKVKLSLDAVPVVGRMDTQSLIGPGNTALFNPQWRRQEDLAEEAVSYDEAHGIGNVESGSFRGSAPLLLGGIGILAYALTRKK